MNDEEWYKSVKVLAAIMFLMVMWSFFFREGGCQ